MTVLSVVQSAATVLGLHPIPDQVFASKTREMVEMKALLNKVARAIAKEHDWSTLKVIHTLTGDGATVDFALPSDFSRLLNKDGQLWSSASTTTPLSRIGSLDDWLAYEVQDYFPPYGSWIVYGGQMHIRAARASGETVKFPYISTKFAAAEGGTPKAQFDADTDTFRLGGADADELLELGVIWSWKAKKGIDYAEEMANYTDCLARCIGNDRGPAILTVGRQRYRGAGNVAFPGVLG